jgi:hypothetical protein
MFRVEAKSLEAYFDFDPKRKSELERMDELIGKSAASLGRYFHRGTPVGQPGMRFKMIGYGKFHYAAKSGTLVEWPVVGIALQKNYIGVYVAITKGGAPITRFYEGELGARRMGEKNFSFERFDDLRAVAVASLLCEIENLYLADPQNPVRVMQGGR